jgi:hypothetical protein
MASKFKKPENKLSRYVAYAITDREIETAALAIELWRAAGLIQSRSGDAAAVAGSISRPSLFKSRKL